ENTTGFLDGPPHLGKLLQRGDGGLIAQEVFALAHRPYSERRPKIGDGGGTDELDRRIIQDFILAAGYPHAVIALLKSSETLGIGRVHRDQFTAAAPDGIGNAIDVAMIEPDDCELDRVFGRVLL